jgi:hypothetical protein
VKLRPHASVLPGGRTRRAALALLPLGARAENTAIPLRADAVKRLKSGDAAQIKARLTK